jgi:Fe2+ transport system protein FeoA
MLTTLDHAPIGAPLILSRIPDPGFAARIARLGLYEGVTIMRLNETVSIGPVRVLGPKGEATLSGWLAAKVVMHLDDDRRLPLPECAPGDQGHVEGLTGHDVVEESLAELGVIENDRLTFVRRVPPMTYNAVVDGKHRVRLNEGLASKLLGDTPGGARQFCSVGVEESFVVRRVLAGESAVQTLESLHIRPGSTLVLTSVAATQMVGSPAKHPIVCTTMDGLRLYFHHRDASRLFVLAPEHS